ncbi:hypothetical protein ACEWET_14345 [Paraliobacillus sp. JSM ZJ581]
MAASAATQHDTVNQTFTGEEYYKGLIFGQGEIGEILIRDEEILNSTNSDENTEFITEVMAYIDQEYPQFFNDLQDAIESKDPTRAQDLLEKSRIYFTNYLESNDLDMTASVEQNLVRISVYAKVGLTWAYVAPLPPVYAHYVTAVYSNQDQPLELKENIITLLDNL